MAKTMKGVNLGGWLVLEPWITPSLFQGTGAPDEFTFCDAADTARFKRLSKFRKNWITRRDFQWLAERGIEAVRIPVGYWAFGDVPPYAGTIEYLDKAFGWAEQYGIKVLVCLHGAPGSQNGAMHSGQQGETAWHTDPKNIEQTLLVIERLAKRYAGHSALLGIELLNEPSRDVPMKTLRSYYRQGYRIVRRLCGPDVWVVFNDGLNPQLVHWSWYIHWPFHRLALQDNHHYQIFSPQDKLLDLAGHLIKAARKGRLFRMISLHRRIIIGEWSATLDPAVNDAAYRSYIQVQLHAYRHADAWFYWTYRTEDKGPWNFRAMVESGVFPADVM